MKVKKCSPSKKYSLLCRTSLKLYRINPSIAVMITKATAFLELLESTSFEILKFIIRIKHINFRFLQEEDLKNLVNFGRDLILF